MHDTMVILKSKIKLQLQEKCNEHNITERKIPNIRAIKGVQCMIN